MNRPERKRRPKKHFDDESDTKITQYFSPSSVRYLSHTGVGVHDNGASISSEHTRAVMKEQPRLTSVIQSSSGTVPRIRITIRKDDSNKVGGEHNTGWAGTDTNHEESGKPSKNRLKISAKNMTTHIKKPTKKRHTITKPEVKKSPVKSPIKSSAATSPVKATSSPKTIPEFFQVRRSGRVPLAQKKRDSQKSIEAAILSENEEGIKIVTSEVKGRGLVVTRPFAAGEYVVEYAGELIDHETAKVKEKEYQAKGYGCYMYYFSYHGKKYCIDATAETGRFGRLINHSMKHSNLKTKTFVAANIPRLIFFARRDLAAGEELLYDYGERNKAAIEHHPWLAS